MKTTFVAVGDCFITRRIPERGYEGFDELKDLIKSHDVKFANLEQTFHDQEGYPSAASGGTWAMAEPELLDEVAKFGFNLYNVANNHTGDYGQGGVLATMQHLKERKMIYAGIGRNLHEASRPCYLETPQARVAMIGVTTSFDPAAAAGGQSVEMHGRPGLNPLNHKAIYHLTPETFKAAQKLAQATLINWPIEQMIQCGYANPFPKGTMPFGKMQFVEDENEFIETIPNKADLDRIIGEIVEAKRQADIVLVNLHVHQMTGKNTTLPAQFHETFARSCIDAGASAVIGHGPHELRGIEVYNDGIIFYSLGNFIFETETTALQPYDAYKARGMSTETKVGAYMDQRSANGTRGFPVMPEIWKAVIPSWIVEDGKITEVKLHPIDLGMEKSRGTRGRPALSRSQETLEYLAKLSEPYGVSIDIEEGVGTIRL